ncbi:MAG: PD-(D/E)XK nuclease family protein [Clostridia bacterium]|nr:PD-(D/E)XK nuclease family protein [Clostridia bacterium]
MSEKCRFEVLKGPSGVGKTAEMVSGVMSDLAAGRRVIFLVPDQTSATAERTISYECQKRGVPRQRLEILSFTRLANSFFIKYGGAAGIGMPKTERRLHIWRAFRELGPEMPGCFSSVVNRADRFVPVIGDLIDEMKREGVGPEDLAKCADPGDGGLGEKLRSIAVIFTAYNRRLGEAGISDPSDGVARFAASVGEHPGFLDGVSVYMDGFVRLSKPELDVIREIMCRGSSLKVSLCCEEGREYIFGTVNGDDPRSPSTEKKLLSLAADLGITPVITVREGKIPEKEECSPGIYYLKTRFMSEADGGTSVSDGVRFFRLPNLYSEAEFAACEIIRAVKGDKKKRPDLTSTADGAENSREEEKAKCSDFTVIAGSAETAALVSVTLGRHGIPNHVSCRRELRETRIFRFVTSALAVAKYRWRKEDVLTFVKTGLTGISADDVYELENYVNLWDIKGPAEWGRKWEMSPAGFGEMEPNEKTRARLSDALGRINKSRNRIFTGLDRYCSDISRGGTLKDACLALYEMLHVSFGADAGLNEKAGAPAEDIRIWNVLCSVLDSISKTAGDVRSGSGFGLADVFTEAFEVAVSGASAGSVPEMSDEVTVAVFGAHTPHTPRAIIVGCNYGSLPPASPSNGLLTDDERDRIREKGGIEIGTPPKEKYYLDNLDFYLALCIPSKDLILSCSEYSPSGEKLVPSEQFETARWLFLGEKERKDEKEDKPHYVCPGALDFVWDGVSAREKLRLLGGTVEGSSLAEVLGSDPSTDVPLRADANGTVDSEAVAERLVTERDGKKTLFVSPSALDNYVACPLKYVFKNEAGLSSPPDIDASKAASDGTLIHHVLEKYFSGEYSREKEHTEEEFEEFAAKDIEELLNNVLPAGSRDVLSRARIHDIERLKKNAGMVLSALDERQKETHFEPKYVEYSVKGEKPVAEVGDVGVSLKGKVDRIDAYDDTESGKRYLRVIDYKSASKNFKVSELEKGKMLQMFLYLYGITEDEGEKAYADAKSDGFDPVPAAVTYYRVKPGKISPEKGESYYDALKEELEIKGVFDGGIRDRFESAISGKTGNSFKLTEFGGCKVNKKTGDVTEYCGDYDKVRSTVKGQVERICGGILSGKAGARPEKDGSGGNACGFCDFRAACRSKMIKGTDDGSDGEGGDENE